MGNDTAVKLLWELKVPCVTQHNLQALIRDEDDLRVEITQALRDMKRLGCE